MGGDNIYANIAIYFRLSKINQIIIARPIFRQSGADVVIATTETSLPLSKGGLEGM